MPLAIAEHALETMRTRLDALDLVTAGEVTVERHWSLSFVARVATPEGMLWYKAVPDLFAQEGAVTAWLHDRAPGTVPDVLGWGPGWLVTRDVAPATSAAPSHPLGALAALQRTVAPAAGDPPPPLAHRPPTSMAAELQALVARPDAFDTQRAEQLTAALPLLRAVCAAAEDCGVPDSVVHGDFQLGNALWTGGGWRLIDWTDAFLGFPLVDLAQPHADDEPGAFDAYAEQWRPVLTADRLARALRLAPAVGAGFHLLMHRRILDEVSRDEHFVASYHMWHARLLNALSEDHL